jgi:hypothetical protein
MYAVSSTSIKMQQENLREEGVGRHGRKFKFIAQICYYPHPPHTGNVAKCGKPQRFKTF